jgi:O-acetyl-ADP-ribose deacetylase (regulator of RNase III)
MAFRGVAKGLTPLSSIETWDVTFNRVYNEAEATKSTYNLATSFKLYHKVTNATTQFVSSSELNTGGAEEEVIPLKNVYSVNEKLNGKIALMKGDITAISEIDAIVNPSNPHLHAGGGVGGVIFKKAGKSLQAECDEIVAELPGKVLETGNTVLSSTGGEDSKLTCRHILHTLGPKGEHPEQLTSCYDTILDTALSNGLRSVAFSCISTGVYGYPANKAAAVALKSVREWLQQPVDIAAEIKSQDSKADLFDKIVFCVFSDADEAYYLKLLPIFFPVVDPEVSK